MTMKAIKRRKKKRKVVGLSETDAPESKEIISEISVRIHWHCSSEQQVRNDILKQQIGS